MCFILASLIASGCVSPGEQVPSPSPTPETTIAASTTSTLQSTTTTMGSPTPSPTPNSYYNVPQHRQSPEIPTSLELSTLPECASARFTSFPLDLNLVYDINPIGNLAPPGHTFPTDHTYLHLHPSGSKNTLYDLVSPGDVFVTSISGGSGFTQDPTDYTIYFALCRDVIAYYNHVKQLSPEIEALKRSGSCRTNPGTDYEYCEIGLKKVSAGSLVGQVGGLQGNFDFGLFNLANAQAFANPSRYGKRSLHIECPYDYYAPQMQERFYSLIKRKDAGRCGTVAQDVLGTLQGNWFFGSARADSGSDWDKHLAFALDDGDASLQVISIGGVFTEASTWPFTPQGSGTTNRNVSQTSAGSIYCYDGTGKQGRIIVELLNQTRLRIEKQSSTCADPVSFANPTTYDR